MKISPPDTPPDHIHPNPFSNPYCPLPVRLPVGVSGQSAGNQNAVAGGWRCVAGILAALAGNLATLARADIRLAEIFFRSAIAASRGQELLRDDGGRSWYQYEP